MRTAGLNRPLLVAIAGPNGAGKSTFFHSQLSGSGLRFVNADDLARQLDLDPYAASSVADSVRHELVRQRESFVFETVFSDPVADKINYLKRAEDSGYQVILCFIGISSIAVSEQRVSMRVSKGGHDVPSRKLAERFPRTLVNLRLAIESLSDVRIFDNDDLGHPYRLVAQCQSGKVLNIAKPVPRWLRPLLHVHNQ